MDTQDPLPIYRANGTQPTRKQWFNQLSEYLPYSYVTANASQLAALYDDGVTPHCAAVYCQAFGLPARAPSLV